LTGPSWLLRTAIALPVAASQTRVVLSSEAVTTRAPSGEKAAVKTFLSSSWPLTTAITLRLLASQTRAGADLGHQRDPHQG
jgi:hypothetical protein